MDFIIWIRKAPALSSKSPFVGKVSEIWHAVFLRKILTVNLPASTKHPSLWTCECECVCVRACVCVCVCSWEPRVGCMLIYPIVSGWLTFQYLGTKPFCISPHIQLFYIYFKGHHSIFIATILGDKPQLLCLIVKAADYRQGLAGYQHTPLLFEGILQMFEDPALHQHVALLSLSEFRKRRKKMPLRAW